MILSDGPEKREVHWSECFKTSDVAIFIERVPRKDRHNEYYYDLKIRRRLPDGSWNRNVNYKPEDIRPLMNLLERAERSLHEQKRRDLAERVKNNTIGEGDVDESQSDQQGAQRSVTETTVGGST